MAADQARLGKVAWQLDTNVQKLVIKDLKGGISFKSGSS
jgi:hypothetical protein